MRTILSIIALFLIGSLQAHSYRPSEGKEAPRSRVVAYATADEATATMAAGNNLYFTMLSDWSQDGTLFSTHFTVPFAWVNRQVLLHVESASAEYEVRLNGKVVAYNANANAPAEFNLTNAVNEGRNRLEINISKNPATAKLEGWHEGATPAIGAVWVTSQPTLRVRDVATRSWFNDDRKTATAEVAIVLKSSALNPRTSRVYYELQDRNNERVKAGFKEMTLDMRQEDTIRFLVQLPIDHLWSAELPIEHTLYLRTQHEGRQVEYQEYRIGFRVVELEEGKMSINGTPVVLHAKQIAGNIGAQAVDELVQSGYNTLQLLPGAVSESLLEYCDAQGVYVIVQAPIDTRHGGTSRRKGGNVSNDPAWRTAFTERIADSYHTTKHHPSVVAFSIANKSANGICLYESYLNMKQFSDSRPFIYPDAAGEWNSDKLLVK